MLTTTYMADLDLGVIEVDDDEYDLYADLDLGVIEVDDMANIQKI